MQPFKAFVAGCNESEKLALRRELAGQAFAHEEFADLAAASAALSADSEAKPLVLVKVNTADDLPHIRHLIQRLAGVPIVALLNPNSDLAAVLNTLRAGASQIVLFPLQSAEFRQSIETALLQFGYRNHRTRVIAVAGVSEGCGATTLAMNLGFEMASTHGKKCVLVELSSRMGRLATYLGVEPAVTINDLEGRREPLDPGAVQQALTRVGENFTLLAGPHRTIETQARPFSKVPLLLECLCQLADVVVLDLPSTFDEAYFQTLALADQVVLVAEQSVASIHALSLVLETLTARKSRSAPVVVVNRFERKDRDFRMQRLEELLPGKQLFTVRDDKASFKGAANSGQALRQYRPEINALDDIDRLAAALLGEPSEPHKPDSFWGRLKEWIRGESASPNPASQHAKNGASSAGNSASGNPLPASVS